MVEALRRGDLTAAPVDDKTRGLLEFAELLTRHSYRTTEDEIQRLRRLGWTDEQIAEAVYVTALFAFYNRVADAFGLATPNIPPPKA